MNILLKSGYKNDGYIYCIDPKIMVNNISVVKIGKISMKMEETEIDIENKLASRYGTYYPDYDLLYLGYYNDSIRYGIIPIIPPSKGHGYDIYTELGTDKVLAYARFDDSTKDFPTDTKFAQVGIIKNPTTFSSDTVVFTENQYSSLYAGITTSISGNPVIGEEIEQTRADGKIAKGYVASYDSETKVLKYFRDRSLYFGSINEDETDYNTVSADSNVYDFQSNGGNIVSVNGTFTASIDTSFNANKVTVGGKVIDLGVTFTEGLANPEINKKTGDIIYIDNRPLVTRDIRQKEDIKIILEF